MIFNGLNATMRKGDDSIVNQDYHLFMVKNYILL